MFRAILLLPSQLIQPGVSSEVSRRDESRSVYGAYVHDILENLYIVEALQLLAEALLVQLIIKITLEGETYMRPLHLARYYRRTFPVPGLEHPIFISLLFPSSADGYDGISFESLPTTTSCNVGTRCSHSGC